MAFVLDGVISKEEIRNMFIADVNKALVGQNFLNVETVLDAESIKIWGVGDVAVLDYNGTAVTTDATDTSVNLTLDQAKYFQKAVDRIDNAQSAIKIISKVLSKGAISTAEAIDDYIFSVLGAATNTVPTVALDDTNVIKWVSDMSVALTNQKAPKAGRKLAVSPEVGALLAEAGMSVESDALATEAARNGWIGRFYGFDIYETLSLTVTIATYDALNETDIPKGTPISVGAHAGVSSGTAVLEAGVLYVLDGTDEAIAIAADALVTNSTKCVASVPDAGYVGIGYQEYEITRPAEGFKDISKGLANYGTKISQEAMLVASDITLA